MRDLSDRQKQQAAHLAARLAEAQDRRSIKEILAGQWTDRIACDGNRGAKQDDPQAQSLMSKRIAALAAQAKGDRARIVIVGESVARGFPYDPQFNCALALREFLDLATGPNEIEVIDLAQNGLTYDGLIELIESALTLKPDAFVVFVGNNWRIPLGVRLDQVAEALRAGKGWQAVVQHIKEEVRRAVEALVARLSELSTRHSIPVIFLIPEFNAADWQSPPDWRNPLLTGARSLQWRRMRDGAENALRDQDYNRAAVLSEAMIDLDDGASPVAYEILAACSRSLGYNAEARRFIDQAGDIGLCVPVLRQPRCYPIIQQTLRSQCAERSVAAVDLPAMISEFLSGALPDRNLFLDSCHMTVEGIRLAMACAAERLLPLLGKKALNWRELNEHRFSIDRRVIAEAHFNAARINARNGQAYDVVRFHFEKAIEHSPEVVDLGLLFVDFSVRPMPYMMCRTFEELLSRRDMFPSISSLAAGPPDWEGSFNVLEIQALKDAVAESSLEAGERIERVLREEHAVNVQEANLLNSPYCDISFGQLEFEWWDRTIYLQARNYESRFHLICDSPGAVQLKLTCRLRHQPLNGETVSILVNGCAIGGLKVSTRWTQQFVMIPAESLRSGVNSLILRWPEPQQSPEQRIEEIIRHLESSEATSRWNRLPDIYPIYGEVHAISAAAQSVRINVETADPGSDQQIRVAAGD